MLRRLRNALHFEISATDGHLGRIHDFLFDDERWTIRYLVVDVSRWFPGRRVLIAPLAAGRIDWEEQEVRVNLTREQVKGSPDISTERPVALQHLAPIHAYYGWPMWEGIDVLAASLARPRERPVDRHLRSSYELRGYGIIEEGRSLGRMADFIFDESTWRIRWLLVQTERWFHKRHVILAPECARAIDWVSRTVAIERAGIAEPAMAAY